MASGVKTPRPPPSTIAGPPIPMFEPSVAMTTSQQPRMAALPAKHRPVVIPTRGTSPLRRPNRLKARQSRPDTPLPSVSPGPPSPALGEEHEREALPLGQLEQAVLLAVVLQALGAGQHRVVVGHHHRRRGRPRYRRRPTRPSAGVRAMSSSTGRRRRWAAITTGPYSTRLPGSRRSSTFSRAVRCPVLRRRRPRPRAGRRRGRPACRARTPSRSARSPDTGRGGDRRDRRHRRLRLDHGEQVAGGHEVAHRHVQGRDDAVDRCLDGVLHLHRLDDDHVRRAPARHRPGPPPSRSSPAAAPGSPPSGRSTPDLMVRCPGPPWMWLRDEGVPR